MKTLAELTLETAGETRLLFGCSYFDGPLNGLMLWNGQKAWFNKVTEELDQDNYFDQLDDDEYLNYYYRSFYKVYGLTTDQLLAIEYNQQLFEYYVGTHTRYDNNNKVGPGTLRSIKLRTKYYRNKQKLLEVAELDYTAANVLGEFEW